MSGRSWQGPEVEKVKKRTRGIAFVLPRVLFSAPLRGVGGTGRSGLGRGKRREFRSRKKRPSAPASPAPPCPVRILTAASLRLRPQALPKAPDAWIGSTVLRRSGQINRLLLKIYHKAPIFFKKNGRFGQICIYAHKSWSDLKPRRSPCVFALRPPPLSAMRRAGRRPARRAGSPARPPRCRRR